MKYLKSLLYSTAFCMSASVFAPAVIHAEEDAAVKNKRLEEKQRQIQRNFMRLISNIDKTTAVIRKNDPDTARRLEKALDELKKLKIPAQMEEVIKYIKSKGIYTGTT